MGAPKALYNFMGTSTELPMIKSWSCFDAFLPFYLLSLE